MRIQIREFKVPISKINIPLKKLLEYKYHIFERFIKNVIISKESIDARDKQNIYIVYNLICDIQDEKYELVKDNKFISIFNETNEGIQYNKYPHNDRPVIVGFGPAGMFAALYLSRCGANPIILERGSDIDSRVKDVERFLNERIIDPNSNVQFGEGGAGTFSDGKLTTNLKDPLISFIINEFAAHGAKKEIIYEAMPHIGTDYLRIVVKNIREEIIKNGGEIYFNTLFNGFKKDNDNIIVKTDSKEFVTKHLLLGYGHSSRDTIKMLYEAGASMEAKAFSMGVRIEHKREDINKYQYGKYHTFLSPAYYKLSCHLNNGRGVYTFCMCPGGEVMASTSEDKSIVTNGMSYNARDKENSNSGLLVSVMPEDFFKSSPLDGMYYQEKYERLAFEISKDYRAPANLVKEFLKDEVAKSIRSVNPSYPHGVVLADLRKCLPDYVVESIKEGIVLLDRKLKGFANPDAVLTGIETRSSSPVRMIRDETRQANIKGLYPIGEGAGYAGGITSAALDGLKTAMYIVNEGD